jgi:hypothetical protein
MSIWWLGTVDTQPVLSTPESVVRDFRAWNFSRYGYYGYPSNALTFDGFVARGDASVIENRHEFVMGFTGGDYMHRNLRIVGADVQNLRLGIDAPYFSRGTTQIADSYLRNSVNIAVTTIGASGSAPYGPGMPPKETVIRNVVFDEVDGGTGGIGPTAIEMRYTLHNGSANLRALDQTYVEGFDGIAGDDFQVFYDEQAPDAVMEQEAGNLAGCPDAGLTNAECFAAHGIATGGELATGASPRAGITGLVRAM